MSNLDKIRIAAIATGVVGLAAFTPAASAGVSAEYSLDLASAYVWRGISVTDGAVFQPSATIGHDSGFSFNVWGNLDIDDVNGYDGDFLEVDLTLSYAFGEEGSSFSSEIGLIEYLFPGGDTPGAVGAPSTTEIYYRASWDVALAPTIGFYYDFDQVDDFYADLGIGWDTPIGGDDSSTSFDISATVGYAGEDFAAAYGGTDSGFFNGLLSLGIGYAPENRWAVYGYVAYTDSLDDDVLPEQPVDFFAGISFSRAF